MKGKQAIISPGEAYAEGKKESKRKIMLLLYLGKGAEKERGGRKERKK